jgi:hypothetical protein
MPRPQFAPSPLVVGRGYASKRSGVTCGPCSQHSLTQFINLPGSNSPRSTPERVLHTNQPHPARRMYWLSVRLRRATPSAAAEEAYCTEGEHNWTRRVEFAGIRSLTSHRSIWKRKASTEPARKHRTLTQFVDWPVSSATKVELLSQCYLGTAPLCKCRYSPPPGV